MKKIVFIACAALLAAASSATAGMNLAWNDCLGGGGAVDRTVECTNTGDAGTLYISFVTPTDIPTLAASDAFTDVQASSSIFSWWFTNPISTRWAGEAGLSGSGVCPSWFAGAPRGGVLIGPTAQVLSSSRIRIRSTIVVYEGEEQLASAGTEYLSGTLILKNNDGTFGNPECTAGGALALHELRLSQPVGSTPEEIRFTSPEVSDCVTFQGGGGQICPGATPTRKASWGSIKSLYR